MARTSVTEADLGLAPTDEEMEAQSAPIDNDDDISLGDDPAPEPAKAEAKPDPAPVDPAPDPTKAQDEQQKTVDLRALQEARAEAREAKRQAAILEQRWNDFLAGSRQQAKPDAPPAPPKASEDPLGAMQWTQEQILAMQKAQNAEREQTEAQQREFAEYQALSAPVVEEYETVAKTDPTVVDAYNALRKSQGEELLAMGYSIPEAQQELARLEREHIKFVAHRGISIADYLKALAGARGWQPAAPAQQAPVKTDMKAIADAQQRHQSLSDAPGGEVVPPLDAKALARMSEKEFKAWMSKKGNEAKFDEIMGR